MMIYCFVHFTPVARTFLKPPRQLGIGFVLIAIVFTAGCSHSPFLNDKDDYRASRSALNHGELTRAARELPSREHGGFIELMERTYLKLLRGDPDIEELAEYAEPLDERLRIAVSRELKTFFYLQTPEDYYASEHEVIWLHLLLSWGYSLQEKYSDGCVEARKAANLLSLPWSEEGRFDDPMLRIFLGFLFALCGDWPEARVDFHAATILEPTLSWVQQLADREHPPTNLILILAGTGPEPIWAPELAGNPLRGFRQVRFIFSGNQSPFRLTDFTGTSLDPHRSPTSAHWYERHLIRDNEIQELVQDSRYGGNVAGNSLVAAMRIGAATTAGVIVGVAGIAVGGLIVYAGLESNSSDTIEAGLTIGAAGVIKGYDMASEGYQSASRDLEEELDPSDQYRFVRFLPEYLWLAWDDRPLVYPLYLRIAGQQRSLLLTRSQPTSITIGFLPDAKIPYAGH